MIYVLISVLLLVVVLLLARRARKVIRRKHRNYIMRQQVESVLEQMPCLESRKEIGAGNIGIIYVAQLREGWQEQLGILWQSSHPIPDSVAVKIVPMEPESQQAEILVQLAPAIDEAHHSENPLALCPFLALGVVTHQLSGQQYLVEIMPHLKGQTLRKVLKSYRLEYQAALRQLLRIFETLFFLEARDCFERSLDNENVMVLSDKSWIRIDIDSAEFVPSLPRYRMIRIARLTGEVLSRLCDVPDHNRMKSLLKRVQATARFPLKQWEGKPLPEKLQGILIESPEELRNLLQELL